MITETHTEVHPYWLALQNWCRDNPYSQIYNVVIRDGVPMKFYVPNGIGMKEIPVRRLVEGKKIF